MGELNIPTAISAQRRMNKKHTTKIAKIFTFIEGIFRIKYSKPKPKDKSITKANIKSKTDQLNSAFPSNCSTKGMVRIRKIDKRINFCLLLN